MTETGPAVAPSGTVAEIEVADRTEYEDAGVPLNLTLVTPSNPVPEIVAFDPVIPRSGVKPPSVGTGTGGDVTVNVPALTPVFESVVTEIWSVREPAGTVAVRAVTETYVVGAATPPNLTWLVDVKPSPFTVTRAPNPPEAGENPVTPTQEGILKCPIRVFQSSSVVGAE